MDLDDGNSSVDLIQIVAECFNLSPDLGTVVIAEVVKAAAP